MIPFSLQLTIKLMLPLLELVPFAFTVALFVHWVKVKSSEFKDKKLPDSMWSILVDSSCPPDFTYENGYFAWAVLNAPDLYLSMWVSSFLSFVALFWSWPTARLIMQLSVFCFVLRSCCLYQDFLYGRSLQTFFTTCVLQCMGNLSKSARFNKYELAYILNLCGGISSTLRKWQQIYYWLEE
ncbi:unnamed protein product [Sphagnum jensenii]|uniref:Uncharacterized protein n=1 Tax=Sphagnum jensenii TaxID=128206 RepID=A0ABP0WBF2_9BRYO